MLPASGGPRSSTVLRDRVAGCRGAPSGPASDGPADGPASAGARDPENHATSRSGARGGLGLRRRGAGAAGAAPGAGAPGGGRCRPFGAGDSISTLPRKQQPSSSPTRGAVRLPSMVAVFRITICSLATRLPCTSPATLDDLGLDVRLDAARLPHRDTVLREIDLPFDLAEDREVLAAGHVADDGDRGADHGLFPAFAGGGRRRGGLRCGGADGWVPLHACSTLDLAPGNA